MKEFKVLACVALVLAIVNIVICAYPLIKYNQYCAIEEQRQGLLDNAGDYTWVLDGEEITIDESNSSFIFNNMDFSIDGEVINLTESCIDLDDIYRYGVNYNLCCDTLRVDILLLLLFLLAVRLQPLLSVACTTREGNV